jgi:hypothetical protein
MSEAIQTLRREGEAARVLLANIRDLLMGA